MRVSEKILRMFEETPPEDMYIVTPSDMAESDITFVPASKADALSVAPGGPQFAVAGNGSPPNNEPRKIKTLPVRGDQSDGAAAPVTSAKTDRFSSSVWIAPPVAIGNASDAAR